MPPPNELKRGAVAGDTPLHSSPPPETVPDDPFLTGRGWDAALFLLL